MAHVHEARRPGQHHASAAAAKIARTEPGREHLAVQATATVNINVEPIGTVPYYIEALLEDTWRMNYSEP